MTPSTEDSEMLPVEQRHRDAAATYYRHYMGGGPQFCRYVSDEKTGNTNALVQAFACFERDHLATPVPSKATGEWEAAAWDWLDGKFLNVEAGHDPNDRDYSADEMVDAFIAGLLATPTTPKPVQGDTKARARELLAVHLTGANGVLRDKAAYIRQGGTDVLIDGPDALRAIEAALTPSGDA